MVIQLDLLLKSNYPLDYKLTFNSKKQQLFLVILIIHSLFFTVKILLGNFFLEDSYEYFNLAENIKDSLMFYSGDANYPIDFEQFTKRPPLYSLFILIFSFLLHSNISILIFQNILSIASIFLCLNLFENYYKTINYKVLFVLIVCSVNQFIYANYLMSELLFQFLIVLLCYLFHSIIDKKQMRYLIYFQAVIIFLFLTKPIFYLFIIPNIILSFWLTKYIKKAYFYSMLPILVCVLYMNWNYQRTGSWSFSSIQNINLKTYNLYYFNLDKYGEDYANKIDNEITEIANTKSSYAEKQNTIKSLSTNYIKKDWISYTLLHIKGGFRMFLDPGRFDVYNFFEFKNNNGVGFLKHLNKGGLMGAFNYYKKQPFLIIIIIPIILIFNLIKGFGFARFWMKNYKTAPFVCWFMLFLIVYIAGLTGIIGAARFLLPILPIYILFATLGLSNKKYI